MIRQGAVGSGVEIDFFDPVSGASEIARGIDPFTAGGAAAIPIPEPAANPGLLFGAAGVAWLVRASRGRRSGS